MYNLENKFMPIEFKLKSTSVTEPRLPREKTYMNLAQMLLYQQSQIEEGEELVETEIEHTMNGQLEIQYYTVKSFRVVWGDFDNA